MFLSKHFFTHFIISFVLCLFGSNAFANAPQPTFIIHLDSPSSIHIAVGDQGFAAFTIINNTPQTFPSIFFKNLPAGVTVDPFSPCDITQPLAGGASCEVGLDVQGVSVGDYILVPEVCEYKGIYCSRPDAQNSVSVFVSAAPPPEIAGPSLAALIAGGQTSLIISNNGHNTVTDITLNISNLPADYKNNISVDNSAYSLYLRLFPLLILAKL